MIQFASAQGDLAKATQLADRGLGANPDSPELLLVSAGIATDQENYVRARELVQSVLKRDPGNLAAMNLMVRLCIQLNDLKVAEEQNAAILQKFPDDESAHLTQAEIAAKRAAGRSGPFAGRVPQDEQGKAECAGGAALTDLYRKRKEYAKCDQLLQEIEKAAPELFNAFVVRLQVLAEQQKFDEFFKQLDARLASRPKEGQTLTAVATILSTVNAPAELDRAKPFFTRFIAQNSNDITAQIAMAMLAYRTLDMKGATAGVSGRPQD